MSNRNAEVLLKGMIGLGGAFEVVMGAAVMLWGDTIVAMATGLQTIPNYPLYWRTMGLLAVTLGSLQLVAARDPARYIVIPLAACCVRFILPILTIVQAFETPEMAMLLVGSTAFDVMIAMVTLALIIRLRPIFQVLS
ncbi:MAG: hypothetical protein JSW61_05105 [Candidatus Thorarchaeota archaeon]|nr:MAG: hypothetical protein JSW61_05105 [Candidatus Thorarchaeota archaeon]